MRSIIPLILTFFAFSLISNAEEQSLNDARKKANKLQKDGNWKEAYEAYEGLLMGEGNSGSNAAGDLQNAWRCLNRTGQIQDIDKFLESVTEKYSDDWRILASAAKIYMGMQHMGYLISGEFKRGHHRGGGKYVNAYERDRVKSLALMEQAMKSSEGEEDKAALGNFYLEF
ncbi:MAG: hypothetical protein VX646_03385, partial [Verrucomicrobiota bacterium]|nr:hypothetical protein [Verrucomicrobiota bacterium]